MRISFLIITACVCIVSPTIARACTPPHFPVPPAIYILEDVEKKEEELSPEEQAKLDDYRQDKARHLEIFNSIYPCPTDEQRRQSRGDKNRSALRSELAKLEQKWRHEDEEENGKAAKYYDVPAETELIHFE